MKREDIGIEVKEKKRKGAIEGKEKFKGNEMKV